jgi:hypothetical protein
MRGDPILPALAEQRDLFARWSRLVDYLIKEAQPKTSKMVTSQRFKDKPRDDLASVSVVAVPQEQRDQLSLPELSKLQARATEAMTIKFSLLSVTEKEEQWDNA